MLRICTPSSTWSRPARILWALHLPLITEQCLSPITRRHGLGAGFERAAHHRKFHGGHRRRVGDVLLSQPDERTRWTCSNSPRGHRQGCKLARRWCCSMACFKRACAQGNGRRRYIPLAERSDPADISRTDDAVAQYAAIPPPPKRSIFRIVEVAPEKNITADYETRLRHARQWGLRRKAPRAIVRATRACTATARSITPSFFRAK